MKINLGPFLPIRGDPYQKKVEFFFSSRYDNLYTNRKPLSSLVEMCCIQIFYHIKFSRNKNFFSITRKIDFWISSEIPNQISPKLPKTCNFIYFQFPGPNVEKIRIWDFFWKSLKIDFFEKIEYLDLEGVFFYIRSRS